MKTYRIASASIALSLAIAAPACSDAGPLSSEDSANLTDVAPSLSVAAPLTVRAQASIGARVVSVYISAPAIALPGKTFRSLPAKVRVQGWRDAMGKDSMIQTDAFTAIDGEAQASRAGDSIVFELDGDTLTLSGKKISLRGSTRFPPGFPAVSELAATLSSEDVSASGTVALQRAALNAPETRPTLGYRKGHLVRGLRQNSVELWCLDNDTTCELSILAGRIVGQDAQGTIVESFLTDGAGRAFFDALPEPHQVNGPDASIACKQSAGQAVCRMRSYL
jgi:hypothetical protein